MINIKEMAKINVHTPEREWERWNCDKEYETLANNNFEVIKLSVRNANGNEVATESHTTVDIYDLITVRHFLCQANFSPFSLSIYIIKGNWENLCLHVSECVCEKNMLVRYACLIEFVSYFHTARNEWKDCIERQLFISWVKYYEHYPRSTIWFNVKCRKSLLKIYWGHTFGF